MAATFAPRLLHPGAWWLWALGLAVAASRTTNPILLIAIAVAAGIVVAERRVAGPWGRSFSLFVKLGVLIIAIRMVVEILLGTSAFGTVLFTLPELPLPEWMAGVTLGGAVTADALLLAAYEGLRLAVMLLCVGAANSLVNPSRLLRIVPAALYEVGVAVVICLTFVPLLVADTQRIRVARRLRGRTNRGPKAWGQMVIPLFAGALDSSVALAASMDSRGYGRNTGLTKRARALNAVMLLVGLLGVAIGLYGLLQGGASVGSGAANLGWAMLFVGLVLAMLGGGLSGRRVTRTRYRPDPWRLPETLVVLAGALPAVVFIALGDAAVLTGGASPLGWPTVPLWPLLAIAVAAAPSFISPPVTTAASKRESVPA
ncbi:MAG: energy-coupling factor transporter transmembrane protein EcfT [Actinomycetia bacterium]|nr:energy-coupling factor transporter transmembrane protein EcfT [Actinomycetes bacterium]